MNRTQSGARQRVQPPPRSNPAKTAATIAPAAYSIAQFCSAHDIHRNTWYALEESERPRTMRIGRRVIISMEAAADWRKRMERRAQMKEARS